MTYINGYEIEYLGADHRRTIEQRMKQVRGKSQAQTKVRELPLSAVLTLGALLVLIAGL